MAAVPPIVLSIAGFDPTSGAGVTADIKTLAAHGCYGVGCVTALTVQATTGVRRVEPVSGAVVRETLRELATDFTIAGVRIGMLGNAEVVEAVADYLGSCGTKHVVLDPIITSTSGATLLDPEGVERLRALLLPLASVITPNTEEASALTGLPVSNLEQMKMAARKLHELGAPNVVITGGHLDKAIDLLSMRSSAGSPEQLEFVSDRLRSTSTHGTGCAFATALAANLANGRQLRYATVLAKAYVTKTIARAYAIGKGAGPVHHLYRMDEQGRPVTEATESSSSSARARTESRD